MGGDIYIYIYIEREREREGERDRRTNWHMMELDYDLHKLQVY